MGFFSNLFGGHKPEQPKAESATPEVASTNPTSDLEKIREKNRADAAESQQARLNVLDASTGENKVVSPSDRYGQVASEPQPQSPQPVTSEAPVAPVQPVQTEAPSTSSEQPDQSNPSSEETTPADNQRAA